MTKRGGWQQNMGIGQRVAELRQMAGLTQEQLAYRLETDGLEAVHCNTLARLERGEHVPAWPLVYALAVALGVTPNDLLTDEERNRLTVGRVRKAEEEMPRKPRGRPRKRED